MQGNNEYHLRTKGKEASAIIACFLILLFAIQSRVLAQPENWELRNYSISDGLSSNTVTSFAKDNFGFLWIGTSNGLNRFDGYNFTGLLLPSGEKHVLSTIKILSLLKDRDGILWVGTVDGLFRFDPSQAATSIQQYRYISAEQVTGTLKQPVKLLLQDQKGRLWFNCLDLVDFTNFGLRYFDPQTEEFTYVQIDTTFSADENLQSAGYVADVVEDPEGTIWFGTSSGIVRYNENVGTFGSRGTAAYKVVAGANTSRGGGKFNDQADVQNDIAATFTSPGKVSYEDASAAFASSRTVSYEDASGLFTSYVPYTDPGHPLQNQTLIFFKDRLGNAWAGSRFGLFAFDMETGTFGYPFMLDTVAGCYGPHSDIFFIDQDSAGYLWLRVNFSLVRVQPLPGGKLDMEHMTKHSFPAKDFKLNSLVTAYVENPSLVWAAVPGYGIYQVFIRRKPFQVDLPGSGISLTTGKKSIVTAVCEDDQKNLWIATPDSGAIRVDAEHMHGEKFLVNPTEFINAISQDAYGNLWFVSRYGVASRKEGAHFVSYRPDPAEKSSLTLREDARWESVVTLSAEISERLVLKDQMGTMWINSGKEILDLYDPDADGFYHLDYTEPGGYNNGNPVRWKPGQERLLPTRRGLLRVSGPLMKREDFQVIPGQTILYTHDQRDSLSISSDHVLDVLVSRHYQPGTIWIATMGGGLNRMEIMHDDAEQVSRVFFYNYTEQDGLCDNAIMGILEDSLGCLWLATHNGLSRFDPSTGIFNNYYEIDGLPANHFSCADPCVTHDGWMNFATESGLLRFDPAGIRDNEISPPVALTNFMIFNQPVIPGEGSLFEQPLAAYKRLDLNYDQNFLSFEFAALNYELPEKNLYRYKLEGLDHEWIFAGSRHYVEYPGLRPGKYTFRVAASNNDGYWNNEGLSIPLRIAAPPWLTWYAFLFYALLMAMAVLAYRRFLLSRARLKTALSIERVEKEKIRELEKVKSRFFANISHEFRTPLTLITGPVNTLLKDNTDAVTIDRPTLGMIARNAKRLQRLINQLLEAARLESGKMRLEVGYGDILEHIRMVAADFASLASSKDITLSADYPDRALSCYFDRDKLEKILCNLLSNALKFTGEGGEVFLTVRLTGNTHGSPAQLEMVVRDTGKGIPPDQLEDIYKPFYQVNYSDTREDEGTGLGLSLTRELVRLHHGTIDVESAPGEGTAFTVHLPVAKEAYREDEIVPEGPDSEPDTGSPEALGVKTAKGSDTIPGETPESRHIVEHSAGSQAIPEEGKGSGDIAGLQEVTGSTSGNAVNTYQQKHSRMVLVAEDNADLRTYISGILSAYEVITAENGMEAWDVATRSLPDLVITDVMMPEMNGVELCRRIRQDMRTSHIPVIMLTAKANFESKIEGLDEGADDYLVKPFDAGELQLRIRNMLLQREKLQQRTRDILLNTTNYKHVLDENPFLSRVYRVMEEHYADEGLRVEDIADRLNLSRSQFYRKTQSETGTTPNELLRKLRIDKSAQLLQSGNYNVAQAMFASGFQSTSNFSRSFRKYMGMNPAAYKKSFTRN